MPQAPASGENACGASRMNVCCWAGGELDHAVLHVSVQGREDAAADAEVRVTHVRPFDRARHAERQAPEAGRRHALTRRVTT